MDDLHMTPEDLLGGSSLVFDVTVPVHVIRPGAGSEGDAPTAREVRLRPLTIGTFQLIMRAARDDPGLIPLLMIKESMVEPALSLEQVKALRIGLVGFLIERIREISGLAEKKSP